MLDQALVSGLNFLTGILVVRYLGLAEFGVFGLAWSVALFLNALQGAFIVTPMMTLGPRREEGAAQEYFGTVLALQLLTASATFVLVLAGVKIMGLFSAEWRLDRLLLPLATAALAFQLQDFVRRYFLTRGRAGLAFGNDLVSYGGQVLLLVGLARFVTLDSVQVLWIIAASSVLAFAVALPALVGVCRSTSEMFAIAREHWRLSRWLFLSVQLEQLTVNLYLWTLGAVVGSVAVGAVLAARNIVGVLHVLFNGLDNFVSPEAARLFARDGQAPLRKFLTRATLLAGVPVLLYCTVVAVFPETVYRLFYRQSLGEFRLVLVLFALSYVIQFLAKPLSYYLLAILRPRPFAVAGAVKCLLALVSCYPAVLWFAADGVLACVIVLNIIGGLLLLHYCRSYAETAHAAGCLPASEACGRS